MKNRITMIFIIWSCIAGGIAGCEFRKEKSPPEDAFPARDMPTPPVVIKSLCYKKEFPFKDNPEAKDIQEMKITITGKKAVGTYDWLPAFKDRRKGTFTGTVSRNTITAVYIYSQEGRQDTVPMQIVLTGKTVKVKGADTTLGLDATLEEVSCQ